MEKVRYVRRILGAVAKLERIALAAPQHVKSHEVFRYPCENDAAIETAPHRPLAKHPKPGLHQGNRILARRHEGLPNLIMNFDDFRTKVKSTGSS